MTVRAFIDSHIDFATAPVGTSFLSDKGEAVPTGGLGWSPQVFWASSLVEFYAALRGRNGKSSSEPSITSSDARRMARAAGHKIFGEDN